MSRPITVHLLVLNYNGRELLAECLPSVVRAAECSRHSCEVVVVDNGSTDGSLDLVRTSFPSVRSTQRPNRGLCSYNDEVPPLPGPVAVLLNNDVKLAEDAVDPLVEPLLADGGSSCFMTAPLCWLFDGQTYEGLKTAVGWRWGLLQATALFPGHRQTILEPGLTASAGAVMAVDRRKFTELGGFDPRYLPGRIEDLDLAFRAYQAGYHALYVPASIAWHKGQASFRPVYGEAGSNQLALRNTLLFQWKNLRHPLHLSRQALGLSLRLVFDVVRAPGMPRATRFAFCRALCAAFVQLVKHSVPAVWAAECAAVCQAKPLKAAPRRDREVAWFQRFAFQRMAQPGCNAPDWPGRRESEANADDERQRARNYPLSRWYVRPLAGRLAVAAAGTRLRPWHLSVAGLLFALAAAVLLVCLPGNAAWGALLVLAAWFCDRADGQLARRQGSASARGAWIDANLDELVDLGLHLAVAGAASSLTGSAWPWTWLIAFLAGKYLLMYGLAAEESTSAPAAASRQGGPSRRPLGTLRAAYHLPGNADVRTHLLLLALLTGWLTAELALVAVYYNVRWIARYLLVARRLAGACPGGAAP